MIHPTYTVSTRLCVKVKANAIWAGVNSAGSTSAGTFVEASTLVTPALGWNFITVVFAPSGGVSTVKATVYKPDGTSTIGSTISLTALLTDSAAFMSCIGGILTCTTCTVSTTYSVSFGLSGVVSTIRLYNYALTNLQVKGHVMTTGCNKLCLLCKIEDNA